jgi:NAD(P)-dependent dehydrogenase (short-subunit alcohol dehydrogenase family)
MDDLRGKVAVVTGGASGIGKGMAARFAAEGMHVVIADVEEAALAVAAEELGVVGVRTDVTDPADVQALADAAVDRFGTVHVICNNAGVAVAVLSGTSRSTTGGGSSTSTCGASSTASTRSSRSSWPTRTVAMW